MARTLLLFSGFNQRANLAVCRTATRLGVPFHIVANGMDDTIYKTIYRRNIVYVRDVNKLDITVFSQTLDSLKRRIGRSEAVVLPNSEFLNRYLLEHRTELEELGIQVPMVEQEVYELLSDKQAFASLCRDNGFTVPHVHKFPQAPCVAKPRRYFSSRGKPLTPELLFDTAAIDRWSSDNDVTDFFFQAYVDGASYYLLFFISSNKQIDHVVFSQENLVQQPNGKSIVAARSSQLHQSQVADRYLDLLVKTGYHGPVMIELKGWAENLHMIEANPRIWGPLQLTVDAGVPIIDRYLVAMGFDVPIDYLEPQFPVPYYWFGGFILATQQGGAAYLGSFDQAQLLANHSEFCKHDVYHRSDSMPLYVDELR